MINFTYSLNDIKVVTLHRDWDDLKKEIKRIVNHEIVYMWFSSYEDLKLHLGEHGLNSNLFTKEYNGELLINDTLLENSNELFSQIKRIDNALCDTSTENWCVSALYKLHSKPSSKNAL